MVVFILLTQNLFGKNLGEHTQFYYTTKVVRGPITKLNQSDYFIAGPIFSKYRTGYCPECVKLIAAL